MMVIKGILALVVICAVFVLLCHARVDIAVRFRYSIGGPAAAVPAAQQFTLQPTQEVSR